MREGILEENELEALEAEVDREILEATDRALAAETPSPDSIYSFVYSAEVDPTGKQFEAQPKAQGHPEDDGGNYFRHAAGRNGAR